MILTSYHFGPRSMILMRFALKSCVCCEMFLGSSLSPAMVRSDWRGMMGGGKEENTIGE